MTLASDLAPYFKRPRVPFGGFDAPQATLEDARVVLFGVPFDGTATYRGGSEYGPWAIRQTSAYQIETNSVANNYDPYMDVGIFDLGDFRFGHVRKGDRQLIYESPEPMWWLRKYVRDRQMHRARKQLNKTAARLRHLTYIVQRTRQEDKVPLILGGEHSVSLWTLRGVAEEEPVVLWFDAHTDCKREYLGVEFSHTAPLYYLLHGTPSIRPENVVQIGIREGTPDEFENAKVDGKSVQIYRAFDERGFLFEGERYAELKAKITQITQGRKVAVTFDIDAFDGSMTPFTGTPSYGGMLKHHAGELINNISPDAEIIYLDFVEAASDGKDTREGTLATEMLKDFLLAHPSLRRQQR